MRNKRVWLSSLFGLVAAAATSSAAAQETVPPPGTAIDPLTPAFAGDRFFGVQSPYAAGHLVPHVQLMANYGHNMVRITKGGDTLGRPMTSMFNLHLNATLPLWDRVAINVDAPLTLFQAGEDTLVNGRTLTAASGLAFNDLRIGLRARILGEYHDPFQLGVGGYVWLPTGPDDSFVSDASVRGLPQVLVGGRVDDTIVYSAAIGVEFRPDRAYLTKERGMALSYGAGIGVLLLPEHTLQLGVEVAGSNVLAASDFHLGSNNLELLGGAKLRFADDFEAGLAAGPGLLNGLGTPQFRGLFTFAYTPNQTPVSDRDGDGINDDADACPDVAGVANDDPAKHGCPPPPPPGDKDGDTVTDDMDACPDVAGLVTDDPKTNGCPPGDRDSDGVDDTKDACPDVAGVATDDPKTSGCPDSDGDKILDKQDACPNTAGPASDDPAKHGCPDSDGDTIIDKLDACPQKAGPVRADAKTSGCPDSDGDGIIDKVDACPTEKGVANKDPKKHGCPIVQLTTTEIKINQRIEFDLAKSKIRKVSNHVLDEVARIMREHPEILLLQIQGHTDNQGSAAINKPLSNARAAAVRLALMRRKVAGKRLVSKGFGDEKPLATNDTPEGRQENRRVQFVILKQKAVKPTVVEK